MLIIFTIYIIHLQIEHYYKKLMIGPKYLVPSNSIFDSL